MNPWTEGHIEAAARTAWDEFNPDDSWESIDEDMREFERRWMRVALAALVPEGKTDTGRGVLVGDVLAMAQSVPGVPGAYHTLFGRVDADQVRKYRRWTFATGWTEDPS